MPPFRPTRTSEQRIRRLEEDWRRIRPALEFYEAMTELGLREALPEVLKWWQQRRVLIRVGVIVGAIIGGLIPLLNLGLLVYIHFRIP